MNVALSQRMGRQAFFRWAEAQEERYEFDGFQPVAMTGGNLDHSRLIRNINRELANRLAGKCCESLGPDAGVGTIGQAVRYPDAVVTFSKFSGKDRLVPNPVIYSYRPRCKAAGVCGCSNNTSLHYCRGR
jgi:hypothetical protein